MSDYPNDQLSVREYFYKVVRSIYLHEIYNMINAVQKKRVITVEDKRCNKIELIPEIAKEIDEIALLPSKNLCLEIY